MLAVGEEGREHIALLNMIGRGAYALLSMNHTVPLLELILLEDITFGVFPKAGWSVNFAYNFWAEASVGDILNIITQCLEVRIGAPYTTP